VTKRDATAAAAAPVVPAALAAAAVPAALAVAAPVVPAVPALAAAAAAPVVHALAPVVPALAPPPIRIGGKQGATTASLPSNPNTKVPRILYTKKQPHVRMGVPRTVKSAVVVPTKTAFLPSELQSGTKKRKFKAKRLSFTVNSKRLTATRLTAARVAKMPIAEVKQKLVKAGLLKGKSNSPPAVLRGLLTDWMQLHVGA